MRLSGEEMSKCNATSYSNQGQLRNLDCPEPSTWTVRFKDGSVSGHPCDTHVADYLHFYEPSTVEAYKPEST